MAEKGKLVVLTSHILEILINMTDYIHVSQDGQIAEIVGQGDFERWKATYRAQEVNKLLNKARKML